MKIFYSSKEVHRRDYMVILFLGFAGIGVLAYFVMAGLSHLLRWVDGAAVILRACFWVLVLIEVFLFAYVALEGSRNELVFGVTEQDGKLYRLPCRKKILRDPLFTENSFELEEKMNKLYRLPSLPQDSQEICSTLEVTEKEGYYLVKCWVKVGGSQKRQDYALHCHFNDMDELIGRFRSLM